MSVAQRYIANKHRRLDQFKCISSSDHENNHGTAWPSRHAVLEADLPPKLQILQKARATRLASSFRQSIAVPPQTPTTTTRSATVNAFQYASKMVTRASKDCPWHWHHIVFWAASAATLISNLELRSPKEAKTRMAISNMHGKHRSTRWSPAAAMIGAWMLGLGS